MIHFCLVAAAIGAVPPNATADTHYPAEEPREKAFAMSRYAGEKGGSILLLFSSISLFSSTIYYFCFWILPQVAVYR